MKILISRKDLKDTHSGVPKKVLQEVSFFKSQGHEAYAIAETINDSMITEFGGHPIKTFKWPFSGLTRRKFYASMVQRWINKNKPQIVIGHGDIFHQDILFIHNCVHLAHELIEKKALPLDHEVGVIHSKIFNKGSFKLLICNSDLMKRDLIQRFNLNPEIVKVIYPEINLKKFHLDNVKDMRSQFNFQKNDFVIGLITSGNFKKRNLMLLIEAFKELKKTVPNLKLFIAGGNVDQKYKNAATTDMVFAPPVTDVKNYYYLIDIFVLPAFIEEVGRSVLEAMYCQKPVITTNTVGASEILEKESRDLIMNEISQEELIKKLKIIIENPILYQKISQLNFETAKKFSAEFQNEQFHKTLIDFKILKK